MESADEAQTRASVDLAPVDMSFLIPPPAAGKHAKPDLPMTGGPFLDNGRFHTIFEALHRFQEARVVFGDEASTRARFHVTGVRLDPCAPQAFSHGGSNGVKTPATKCRPELRLVVQPWTETDDEHAAAGDVYEDTAIHLVFRLDSAGLDAAVRDLGAMRAACNKQLAPKTTAQSLVGPHPCLVGLGSTDKAKRDASMSFLTAQVLPFLKKHATPARLAGAAAMLGINGGEEEENFWEFRLFVNSSAGLKLVPKLPFNPAVDGSDQSLISVTEEGTTFPVPTAKIHRPSGGDVGVGDVQALASAMRMPNERDAVFSGDAFKSPAMQKAIVGAYAAANPRLNVLPDPAAPGKDGLDCATCHIQGPLTTILEKQGVIAKLKTKQPALFNQLVAAAYAGDLEGKSLLPETRAFFATMVDNDHTTEQFVVNFGYLGRSPAINPRTVNEAIEAAAFLKRAK